MARPLVAVALELDFPASRHLAVLAGIHRWVDEHGAWDIRLDEKIVFEPAGRLDRYAGVIARATPALATAARKRRVPVVNVWQASPVAGKLAGVFPDGKSMGSVAAESLLLRGFTSFGCIYTSDHAVRSASGDSFCRVVEQARPELSVARLPVRLDEVMPILSDAFIDRLGTPTIWRRIQIKDCFVFDLHWHIQGAFGWTNSQESRCLCIMPPHRGFFVCGVAYVHHASNVRTDSYPSRRGPGRARAALTAAACPGFVCLPTSLANRWWRTAPSRE